MIDFTLMHYACSHRGQQGLTLDILLGLILFDPKHYSYCEDIGD